MYKVDVNYEDFGLSQIFDSMEKVLTYLANLDNEDKKEDYLFKIVDVKIYLLEK